MTRQPKRLHLRALRPYEDRLLACLAFFRFKRSSPVQAHHVLSMYLRQSESRIMTEVKFYAESIGMTARELMELIYNDPDSAIEKIEAVFESGELGIHDPLDSDTIDSTLDDD